MEARAPIIHIMHIWPNTYNNSMHNTSHCRSPSVLHFVSLQSSVLAPLFGRSWRARPAHTIDGLVAVMAGEVTVEGGR